MWRTLFKQYNQNCSMADIVSSCMRSLRDKHIYKLLIVCTPINLSFSWNDKLRIKPLCDRLN